MKRILIIGMLLATVMMAGAQDRKKFSPEKFQADMEEYISEKANLTPQEEAKIFPLLREMHKKQRAIYKKVHRLAKNKPTDEAACASVIEDYDNVNIELKQIEKCYHKKMMQEVPASKVYEVIKAEYYFHRGWMKGIQKDKRR